MNVSDAEDLDLVRVLFREYVTSIGVDLAFQGFEEELAQLPGDYTPPKGCLLVAGTLGCVAVHPYLDGAELKRLYVRPAGRGQGLGRALTEEAIRRARAAGHAVLRLDTLAHMGEALALYHSLGFRDVEPYRFNPLPGARYLALQL
jgi:putative acetyltransferase